LSELESIKTNLEKVVAMQQDYAKLSVTTGRARINALAELDGEFPADIAPSVKKEISEFKP
jgi:hypothetical protein